jgi:hypothetical protein
MPPRPPASNSTRLADPIKLSRDAPSAVGCHHPQIAENPAGIVTKTPLPGARQRHAEPIRQPQALRDQRQQRATRPRRQTRRVRDDIYRIDR